MQSIEIAQCGRVVWRDDAPAVVHAHQVGSVGALIFGAVMLALMDGSFNVTFQPFRALVADMTPEKQRNLGYSVQSLLINIGAVIGSALPFVLTALGASNKTGQGEVPLSVIWSFYIGGSILLLSVLVTVFRTKEYPPSEFRQYNNIDETEKTQKEGFFRLLAKVPKTMKQLALVQLFSWFPLFLMWVYYSSQILFLGAELIQARRTRHEWMNGETPGSTSESR